MAKTAKQALPIGDNNRVPRGSVSECQAVLWELQAVVAGALELVQGNDKAGLDTTGKTLAAEGLLGLARNRCEELRELLEPELEVSHG